jgi:hypothetical protein
MKNKINKNEKQKSIKMKNKMKNKIKNKINKKNQ